MKYIQTFQNLNCKHEHLKFSNINCENSKILKTTKFPKFECEKRKFLVIFRKKIQLTIKKRKFKPKNIFKIEN